jgi:hypothetical protein
MNPLHLLKVEMKGGDVICNVAHGRLEMRERRRVRVFASVRASLEVRGGESRDGASGDAPDGRRWAAGRHGREDSEIGEAAGEVVGRRSLLSISRLAQRAGTPSEGYRYRDNSPNKEDESKDDVVVRGKGE